MTPEQISMFVQAVYSMLAEVASHGGPVGDVLRESNAEFPNASTMHLVLPLGVKKVVAVVVESEAEPCRYSVYWPVSVDAMKVREELMEKGRIAAEMRLVTNDMIDAVSLVKSIVLTELVNQQQQNDGKEGSEDAR